MKILTQKFVPKKYKIEEIDPDKIRISFKRTGSGSNPTHLTFDENFIAGCAMYLGDGKKKDPMHLEFTSKDKDMVKYMLNYFLNYFNWHKTRIRYEITYKIYRQEMISEWARYLGIPEEMINLKQSDRHKHECMGMQIGSVIFKSTLLNIFNYLLEQHYLDQKKAAAFLKGIFAAEGCVAIMYAENYIGNIGMYFSIEEEHLIRFTENLLKNFSISYSPRIMKKINCRGIVMTEWNNYWRLFKLGIFELNERKKDLFWNMMKERNFWFEITDCLKFEFLKDTNKRKLAQEIGVNYTTLYLRFKNNTFSLNHIRSLNEKLNLDTNFLKQNILSVRIGNVTYIEDKDILEFLFKNLW